MPTDGLGWALGLSKVRRRRYLNRPIVLLYHRVGRTSSDPQLLTVSPRHFAEHLQLIAEQYTPVRLSDLVTAVVERRAPARAVAVTFDDGYADNLLVAKPLLERTDVPATVFVASGYVHDGRPFWWDELERLLLSPGRLPSMLDLDVGGETLRWELRADARYTTADAAERAGWTVLDSWDPGPRQEIYRALCGRLRAIDEVERDNALERLRALAEVDHPVDGETPRPVTLDELERLADEDLVEIGAHTVTHPVLSGLPPERQREEVAGSKRQLEDALGRPISAFAYPYGANTDFDETTVSLVRDAGFNHACSNVPGRLDRRTDPFRLPRILIRNWSRDELSRCLSEVEP